MRINILISSNKVDKMALSDGSIERWSLADVLAIKPNLENRT